MKKIAVLAAALALSVVAAPVALAQDDPPSCAELQLAFTDAQRALDAAVLADEAAAAAEAADNELAASERAEEDAQEDALSAGVPVADQNAGAAARIRAELADLEDIPVGERTQEQQARIDQIRERLPLIEAVVAAQARVATARTAAASDADRLQDVADETDATALTVARDEARDRADEVCGGVTTTPAPAPENRFNCVDFPLADARTAQDVLAADIRDPHNLDTDGDGVACEVDQPSDTGIEDDANDASNDGPVVVPNGGVNTGGGPAWAFPAA